MSLHLSEHPLAGHLLTRLRDKTTEPDRFRSYAYRLSLILTLDATKELAAAPKQVETPLEPIEGTIIEGRLALVPILRAGLSMLEPALRLFPDVAVGYVGMERSEKTAVAHSYYCKLPPMQGCRVLLLDPMLATGGSATQACDILKSAGAEHISLVCVVAAPEGRAKLEAAHPDVDVYAAALDRELDERKFILPGLGDYGDRLYGTP